MPIVLPDFLAAVENFHRSYDKFLLACERLELEDQERSGVCGVWSPKQVVAHLAGWLREEPLTFRQLILNPDYRKRYDEDEFNAQSVAARADWDWDQTLADFIDSYRSYDDAIAEIIAANPQDWRPFTAMLRVMGDDFLLHEEQLAQWLPADRS